MKKCILLALFICLVGCDYVSKRITEHGAAVVQVGSVRLTLDDLREVSPGWDTLSAEIQAEFLKKWVDEELLYQAALESDIDKNPNVKRALENAQRKIVTTAYLSLINDSIKVSKEEARAYYETHSEDFLYGKYTFSGVILSYSKWDVGYDYFKSKKNEHFTAVPKADYRIKSMETFENVLESPDSCLVENLRTVNVGTLTGFKVCGRSLKSLILLSFEDSALVRPFEDVKEDAFVRVGLEKRKKRMDDLRLELKRETPVFADWKPVAKEN